MSGMGWANGCCGAFGLKSPGFNKIVQLVLQLEEVGHPKTTDPYHSLTFASIVKFSPKIDEEQRSNELFPALTAVQVV